MIGIKELMWTAAFSLGMFYAMLIRIALTLSWQ